MRARLFDSWCDRFLLVAALLVCPTVKAVSVDKANMRSIYENARGAHLVEVLFDSQGRGRLSSISASDLQSIENELNAFAKFMSDRYSVHRDSLQRVSIGKLPEHLPPVRVVVAPDESNATLASVGNQCSGPVTGGELRIVFSLQSVDALVRGGLAAAYASTSALTPLRLAGEGEAAIADGELAKRYLKLTSGVKSPAVELDALQLAFVQSAFQQVEGPLEGAILFVIGHEIGHQVLRHRCLPCPADINTFQQRELDADYFGATLTTSVMLDFIPVPWLQDSFDGSTSFVGAAVFLQEAYERLRLSSGTGSVGCRTFPYPTQSRRDRAAASAIADIIALQAQDMRAGSDRALDARIDEISKKYELRARTGRVPETGTGAPARINDR